MSVDPMIRAFQDEIATLRAEIKKLQSQLDRAFVRDVKEQGELRAEIARLREALQIAEDANTSLSERMCAQPRMTLTGLQIQHMWDYCDGDTETEMTVARYEESTDEETGEIMPAGLYTWFTDYPDEGRLYLPETAEAALATPAESVTPSAVPYQAKPVTGKGESK